MGVLNHLEDYKDQYFYQALVDYVADKNLSLFVLEGNPKTIQECREQMSSTVKPHFINKFDADLKFPIPAAS